MVIRGGKSWIYVEDNQPVEHKERHPILAATIFVCGARAAGPIMQLGRISLESGSSQVP